MPQDLVPGKYQEAVALSEARKWAEAAIVLKTIHEEQPEFFPAAIRLSTALLFSGRREESLRVLCRVAAQTKDKAKEAIIRRVRVIGRVFLNTEHQQIFEESRDLMRKHEWNEAKKKLEAVLNQEPDNTVVLVLLAQNSIALSDYESAIERLRFAADLNPFEPDIKLWLGRVFFLMGDTEAALSELRIAQAAMPRSDLAANWLAQAFIAHGQAKAAIELLRKVIQAEPLRIESLITLSLIELNQAGVSAKRLWDSKTHLQLALSRLEDYAKQAKSFETELDLDVRSSEELRAQINELLAQADKKLKHLQSSKQVSQGT